jgi:hypothetical protein
VTLREASLCALAENIASRQKMAGKKIEATGKKSNGNFFVIGDFSLAELL